LAKKTPAFPPGGPGAWPHRLFADGLAPSRSGKSRTSGQKPVLGRIIDGPPGLRGDRPGV